MIQCFVYIAQMVHYKEVAYLLQYFVMYIGLKLIRHREFANAFNRQFKIVLNKILAKYGISF